MTKQNQQWLLFSDLDGTLLHHHNYSYEQALPAIKKLQTHNIPIIFNTSKTADETITLQQVLNINYPFIVENGSCIYVPSSMNLNLPDQIRLENQYSLIEIGKSAVEIREILQQLTISNNNYIQLSQCSVAQAIELTGLSETAAKRAIQREYSEPIIWKNDADSLNAFKTELAKYDLNTLQGGRFLHILGNCDKGVAAKHLATCYGRATKIAALGDSPNDYAMLKLADISIIIKSPSSHLLTQQFIPTFNTRNIAPEGWSEAVDKFLQLVNQTGSNHE